MSPFEIKSSKGLYKVLITTSWEKELTARLKPNDIIITDNYIYKYYFQDIFVNNIVIDLVANEETKSFSHVGEVINKILITGFTRNNHIYVLGGGIIQDIASFIASILFRGVDWTFFPTTLLAQGDSCIGGKTSINFQSYKNQLGTFHPPSEVVIDYSFLNTLPEETIKSGLGELAHYFFIDGSVNDLNEKSINELIYNALQIKKGFIEQDEFDAGIRLLLNFGHSFGHAIESATSNRVPHGLAVAYGMSIANWISYKSGLMPEEVYDSSAIILNKLLSFNLKSLKEYTSAQYIIKALERDKKNTPDSYGLILSRGPGEMELIYFPKNSYLTEWLEEWMNKE